LIPDQFPTGIGYISLRPGNGTVINGNNSFFAAFPKATQKTGCKIDIIDLQGKHFRYPQSRAIH